MIGTKFYKPLETQEQLDAYSSAAEWCNNNNATIEDKGEYYEVVPVIKSLDEAKENKVNELKSVRDTKEVEPVQTSKGIFDYDDKSRDRLAIARQSLTDNPSVESIVWTTADNQRVAMTISDFAEINSMAAYRSNRLHVKYNDLKAEVNAAQTVEEVEAIHWPED